MKQDDIEGFAEILGADTLDANGNLLVQCPFAPWTHKSGRDRTPSMSIQVNSTGHSAYHCFGCKEEGGDLDMMLFRLDDYGFDREIIRDLRKFVEVKELVGGGEALVTGNYEKKVLPVVRMSQPPPKDLVAVMDDADFAKSYAPAYDHPYIAGRGIKPETAETFDIRFDSYRDMVVLPIRWYTGELVGAKGRAVTQRGHYNYWRFPKALCLFGEHLLKGETVIVTEGEFDAMKVHQAGFNAVSVMGAKFSIEQVNKLVEFGQDVVIFFDNDEVGQEQAGRLRKALRDRDISAQIVMPPEGRDAGELSSEEIKTILAPLLTPEELVNTPLPSFW